MIFAIVACATLQLSSICLRKGSTLILLLLCLAQVMHKTTGIGQLATTMNVLTSLPTNHDVSHTIPTHNKHLIQKRHRNKQLNAFFGILSFNNKYNLIVDYSFDKDSTNSSTHRMNYHKKEAHGLFFNFTTLQAKRNENIIIQN